VGGKYKYNSEVGIKSRRNTILGLRIVNSRRLNNFKSSQ
jgi:hypothetical protein